MKLSGIVLAQAGLALAKAGSHSKSHISMDVGDKFCHQHPYVSNKFYKISLGFRELFKKKTILNENH